MQDQLKNAQVRQNEAATHIEDLRSQIKIIEEKINQIKKEKTLIERKISDWKQKHENAKKEIKKIKKRTDGVVISEHAIVRYFERILNFNIEEIKDKILGGNSPKNISGLIQEGKLPLKTHKLVIREGTVVTILTQEGQNH